MSVNIKLKHSSVQDKAPQPTDLTEGELALNINSNSPAAYIKDSAGAVVKLAGVGAVGATDATTTSKGVVQLADAAAVTAGTAGVVVDAAQLKVVADAAAAEDLWDRSGTELTPKNAGDDVFTSGDVKVGGTTAAPNLQIKDDGGIVANTDGLVYDATNKRLGLGTAHPQDVLDIEGASSPAIRIRNSTTGSAASPQSSFIYFYGHRGTGNIDEPRASIEAQDKRVTAQGGWLNIATADSSNVLTNALHIDYKQRVGINTTNPSSVLSLGSSADEQKLLLFDDGPSAYNRYGFGIQTNEMRTFAADSAALTFGHINSANGTTYSEKVRITADGKLGLGTSFPSTTNGGLDIASGGIGLIIGADGSFSSRTDAKTKQAKIGAYHYINSEEPVGIATVFSTATSNGVYFGGGTAALNAATALEFYTAADTTTPKGTLRMVIDSLGRVGIGTQTPGSALEINASAATSPFIAKINNSEKARIDSSGRLLVGTSTSVGVGSGFESQLQIADTTVAMQSIANYRNDLNGPYLVFGKSRGSSVGTYSVVQADDQLGTIRFAGADGGDLQTNSASIAAFVDGTPGANNMPGRLVFSTTADGASIPTEAMRITNAREVLVGTTAYPTVDNTAGGFGVSSTGELRASVNNGQAAMFKRSSSDGTLIDIRRDASTVGSISVTQTATAYNTSSDYRLKENVVPLTGASDRLNQLQVHRFNFIADSDKTVDGFIAHEAQAVVPEAVHGTKDEVDDEGNPVYQGIDQSKLVPLLTAALQEALAEIESLKARVTALEP